MVEPSPGHIRCRRKAPEVGFEIGENQKGTAGRGREKNVTTICDKRHDNLRQLATNVTTIYDIFCPVPFLPPPFGFAGK